MADVNNRKDFRRLKEIEKDKLAEKIRGLIFIGIKTTLQILKKKELVIVKF